VATLDLYIDFKSPASYLAFKPTLALLNQTKANAHWKPIKTKQRSIPAESENESRGETHTRVRENARRSMHLFYADLQSTQMRFADPPGDSDLALAALLYTQNHPIPFITAAYEAYWVSNLDLADEEVVSSLLRANGYDDLAFDSQHYLALQQESQASAEAAGIFDAPGYLIEDNVFIGREHLPWIAELLTNG